MIQMLSKGTQKVLGAAVMVCAFVFAFAGTATAQGQASDLSNPLATTAAKIGVEAYDINTFDHDDALVAFASINNSLKAQLDDAGTSPYVRYKHNFVSYVSGQVGNYWVPVEYALLDAVNKVNSIGVETADIKAVYEEVVSELQ
ncbi:MAG: hypothetical protein R2792_04350 [Saprospiraceae bacterium]